MSETPSWERLENEGTAAYDAFCFYRDMPKPRSVLSAYKQKTGRTQAAHYSGCWATWTSAHTWTSRVEDYDDFLERKARAEKEKAYIKDLDSFRKRQKEVAQAGVNVAVRILLLANKTLDKMQTVGSEIEIPLNLLPSYIRAAAAVAEIATNSEAQSLAVEELLKSLAE